MSKKPRYWKNCLRGPEQCQEYKKVHSVIPIKSTNVGVKCFSSSTVLIKNRSGLDVASLPIPSIGSYVLLLPMIVPVGMVVYSALTRP